MTATPAPTLRPPDAQVAAAARDRLAGLAVPAGALGRLGDLGVWLAACQGQVPPRAPSDVRLAIAAGEVVGRGTGVDDAGLARKTEVVGQALRRVGDRADDPRECLAALGSADLAAATAYLLTAARAGVPVLLDGLMSVACALTADRIEPGVAAWCAAGHRSTEPAQSLALDKLGLVPLLGLDLRLGEGSGAVAAVPLVRAAAALLSEVALLADLLPPDA